MKLLATLLISALLPSVAKAGITPIELTPTDVGSGNTSYFTTSPTADPTLFLTPGSNLVQRVDFNTAPDGPLSEGGDVNTQYQSLGVLMNDIRITASIYGGNNYGAGYATEDDAPQVYTFTTPVVGVGIVNTSPDNDTVQFWSGPNGTGDLLHEFHDQEGMSPNFNIDRFVGGMADGGTRIGSFVVFNNSGDLELDELIFFTPTPGAGTLLGMALIAGGSRRRR